MNHYHYTPQTEEDKIKEEEERKRKERIEKAKLWQLTLRQAQLEMMKMNRPEPIEIL